MSAFNYRVASTVPTLISSGGSQRSIVNTSFNITVMVSDTAGLGGYPLGPARGLIWDAGKPLYAWVTSGSAVLTVTDNATAVFNPVAVVGT